MFQNKNNGRGFTIVEMLVVIAVVAILASVVLVSLRNVRPSAYDARRIADLQKVQTYLEIYYNQNRAYPTAQMWSTLSQVLSTANIVDVLPNDPLINSGWQNYYYEVNTNDGLQSYVLGATLSSSNNSVLSESTEVDNANRGFTTSFSCDDPVFCIKS